MGLRHLLILFFSVLAASLVILIMFFSLFFDKLDLTFNTRVPDTAPSIRYQNPGEGPFKQPLDGEKNAPESSEGEEAEPAVGFVPPNRGFWPRSALVNVPPEAEGPVRQSREPAVLPSSPELDTNASDETDPLPNFGDAPVDEPLAEENTPLPSGSERAPAAKPSSPSNSTGENDTGVIDKSKELFRSTKNAIKSKTSSWKDKITGEDAAPTPQEEPAPKPAPPAPGSSASASEAASKNYRVYVGGFASQSDAQSAANRYRNQGLNPMVKTVHGQPALQFGIYSSEAAARRMAEQTGAAVEGI